MTEADVEQIVQRAREHFPGVTPRIISDNGPQSLFNNWLSGGFAAFFESEALAVRSPFGA
jgi:hypothetical protein